VGSSNDTTRVLSYFNMAYRKVYQKVVERYPWAVQQTQAVSITAGSGTLATMLLHIISVRDVNNSYRKLDPTDVEAVESKDPSLNDTGKPDKFWIEGFSTVKSHPSNDTTLQVRGTPNPEALDENSTEADIKIPPAFHDVLTWETLELMAYDERDKVVGAELAYNKEAHDDVYDRMWRYFDAKAPHESKPVKSYLS
jgi:hypothetical protein